MTTVRVDATALAEIGRTLKQCAAAIGGRDSKVLERLANHADGWGGSLSNTASAAMERPTGNHRIEGPPMPPAEWKDHACRKPHPEMAYFHCELAKGHPGRHLANGDGSPTPRWS